MCQPAGLTVRYDATVTPLGPPHPNGLQVVEAELPSNWSSALFYGDFCGDCLDFNDRVQILLFQRINRLNCCQDMDETEVRTGISRYRWLINTTALPSDEKQKEADQNPG